MKKKTGKFIDTSKMSTLRKQLRLCIMNKLPDIISDFRECGFSHYDLLKSFYQFLHIYTLGFKLVVPVTSIFIPYSKQHCE